MNMSSPPINELPSHFKGKEAIEHVAETQAAGIVDSTEIHGTEVPGHISSAADSARETALVLLLLMAVLMPLNLPIRTLLEVMGVFSIGWIIWKSGRSAWLGWSRLERLHRVLEQERYEIQHHRQQERDELRALYAIKGLEGKLLEEVLDVLMADDERLLRIMLEEELRLSLESHEHPLKQAVGAFIGGFLASVICLAGLMVFYPYGMLLAAFLVLALGGMLSAYHARNRLIPAIVWNIGLGVLTFGSVYFLLQYIFVHR